MKPLLLTALCLLLAGCYEKSQRERLERVEWICTRLYEHLGVRDMTNGVVWHINFSATTNTNFLTNPPHTPELRDGPKTNSHLGSNVIWGWKLSATGSVWVTSYPYQLGIRDDEMVVWCYRTNSATP